MAVHSEEMLIGEVAERMGVRASALRYYESVGLLPETRRVSGQRRYDVGVLKHVRFIQAAQAAGFSIEEMKILLGTTEADTPYADKLHELAARKLAEVEALIAQAQSMKAILEAAMQCHCLKLEECLIFLREE